MAEIYPMRSPGEFGGSKCWLKGCRNYARFTAIPWQERNGRKPTCGQHLSPTVKGIFLTTGKPPVIQEVPGNWGHNETALIDGVLMTVTRDSNGRDSVPLVPLDS